jgi:sugar lactone lactonase YvrE
MATLLIVAAIVLYVVAWPVPIDPVAWESPADRGLTGMFDRNNLLGKARAIDLGEHAGPEDVALGLDGFLYATTHSGKVLRISPSGRTVEVFAQPGGRPLGIEVDADGSLLIANAVVGVQRVSTAGVVSDVLTEIEGEPLLYADDIAVARDGTIYVSEASTKFGAYASGGTLEGSLLDILEHGGNGLVIEYKPDTGLTRVIMDGLNFANGLAVSDDQRYLLVAETGSYRIHRYWLQGPNAGRSEIIIDNLPGFPDNINNGMNGRFWIGLAAPRKAILDDYSAYPFIRKMLQRAPAFLRPKPELSSHVIAITGDGKVLMNLQDPDAVYPMMTGVLETRTTLFLTRLIGNKLPYLVKEDLL